MIGQLLKTAIEALASVNVDARIAIPSACEWMNINHADHCLIITRLSQRRTTTRTILVED